MAENFRKSGFGIPPAFLPRPLLRTENQLRQSEKPLAQKKDFRFAESVSKPHALPEYLEGRTQKENHPFLFQKKFHPRQIRNARSVFSFGVAGVLASAWGFGSFVQFLLEKSSCKVYNYRSSLNFTHWTPDL